MTHLKSLMLLVLIFVSGCMPSGEDMAGTLHRAISVSRQLPAAGTETDSLVLAEVDHVFRRSLVVTSKQRSLFEIDAEGKGSLQFWLAATTGLSPTMSLTVSMSLNDGSRDIKTEWMFPAGNHDLSRWKKIELPLKKLTGTISGSVIVVAEGDQTTRDNIRVFMGSPVFVPTHQKQNPDVILIVLDSLRARDLGSYGSHKANSPFLDRFSSRTMTYSNALSTSSWTMPAVKNLFSGQYSNRFTREGENLYEIRDPFPVIQEIFAEAGWFTGAISANHLITSEKGYERGFDVFDSGPSELWQYGSSQQFYHRAIELIDQNKDKPFFLYWHIMDPHDPYTPVMPFEKLCESPDKQQVREFLHPRESGHLNFEKPEDRKKLTDLEKEFLHANYRGEIRQVDSLLYMLFQHLSETDLLEDTIVLITADHGEEFGEHGFYQHGKTLFEDSVRVPFFLKAGTDTLPGLISDWVSTLDIPDTLTTLSGIDFPDCSQGLSIYPQVPESQRTLYTLLHRRTTDRRGRAVWRSAYRGSEKVMWMNQIGWTCSDLDRYPDENHGFVEPDLQRLLNNPRLSQWHSLASDLNESISQEESYQSDTPQNDKKLTQKLRQLGYIK